MVVVVDYDRPSYISAFEGAHLRVGDRRLVRHPPPSFPENNSRVACPLGAPLIRLGAALFAIHPSIANSELADSNEC